MGCCVTKHKPMMNEDEYVVYLRVYKYLFKHQGKFEVATYKASRKNSYIKKFISNSEIDKYNSLLMYNEINNILADCTAGIEMTSLTDNQFSLDVDLSNCDRCILVLYEGLN